MGFAGPVTTGDEGGRVGVVVGTGPVVGRTVALVGFPSPVPVPVTVPGGGGAGLLVGTGFAVLLGVGVGGLGGLTPPSLLLTGFVAVFDPDEGDPVFDEEGGGGGGGETVEGVPGTELGAEVGAEVGTAVAVAVEVGEVGFAVDDGADGVGLLEDPPVGSGVPTVCGAPTTVPV